jgi:hypothetical protein
MDMVKYRFLKVLVLFVLINLIKKFHQILVRYVKWKLIAPMQILLNISIIIIKFKQVLYIIEKEG